MRVSVKFVIAFWFLRIVKLLPPEDVDNIAESRKFVCVFRVCGYVSTYYRYLIFGTTYMCACVSIHVCVRFICILIGLFDLGLI